METNIISGLKQSGIYDVYKDVHFVSHINTYTNHIDTPLGL